MEQADAIGSPVRLATHDDACRIAQLLHDFNTEFDTETPGHTAIASRLRELLAGDSTFCVVAGDPIVGLGLVTLRTNVWFERPVALLDELYVVPPLRSGGIGTALMSMIEATCRERAVEQLEINVDEGDHDARRFYERHGYRSGEGDGDRALFYERVITSRAGARPSRPVAPTVGARRC
jgi:GNAT superfamily N-acetyltransferase